MLSLIYLTSYVRDPISNEVKRWITTLKIIDLEGSERIEKVTDQNKQYKESWSVS